MDKQRAQRQELFDTIIEALFRQGQQSVDNSGNYECVYRGPEGLKCAVGHIIPDELYGPRMEGGIVHLSPDDFSSPEDAAVYGVLQEMGLTDDKVLLNMLRRLQEVHDSGKAATTTFHWPRQFRAVGEEFLLNTSVIDKYEHLLKERRET